MCECQPGIVIVRADGAELSRLPKTVKKQMVRIESLSERQ